MRSSIALFALFGLIAGPGLTANAADPAEPVNPFTQPSPGRGVVSTNISDESDDAEEPGFSFPRLSLPKLLKPKLPKMAMPKFQMPKVAMPQWMKKEPVRDTGPSAWEKLNDGTKSMFIKTRDTLMPWAVKDEAPPSRSVTGSRSSTGISRSRVASNRNSRNAPVEKKSFFGSLLSDPAPEERPIRTTSDFLSQERPRID